jgi:hypothetical protein
MPKSSLSGSPVNSRPVSNGSGSPGSRARGRPRDHDFAVLAYLGREQLATLDQVILRFWVYRGKGPRNGYRVVSRLVESGLIEELLLDEKRGGASQRVLQLTNAGWEAAGFKHRKRLRKWINRDAQWDFLLQQTEVRLTLEVHGWSHVSPDTAYSVLRGWALDSYRRRPLTDTERVERGYLERTAPFDLAHRVVRHERTGDVRILVPIRDGVSYQKTIDQLPHFRLFPPVTLHLVSQNDALSRRAKDYIKRWERARRLRLKRIAETTNFRLRPPAYLARPTADLYAKYGVKAPHALIRPGTLEP